MAISWERIVVPVPLDSKVARKPQRNLWLSGFAKRNDSFLIEDSDQATAAGARMLTSVSRLQVCMMNRIGRQRSSMGL